MGRKGTGVELRANSIRLAFYVDGEEIRETLRVGSVPMAPTPANIKYANRLALTIRQRIDAGTYDHAEFFPDSPRAKASAGAVVRFGDTADLWLKSKGRLAPATRDQYGSAVRFWKKLLGEQTPVADLTHKVLAAKIGGHPWPSAKTHNNYLIALRGIVGLEFRGPLSASNPLIGVENAAVVRGLPDPLSPDERDQVLADLRKHYPVEIWAYFQWQFWTGMRPEETIALRWSDIDTQQGTARVQRVRTFRGSERDGSKTHTIRDVDLLPQALEALKAMRPITSMLRVKREKDEDTSADIFRNPVTRKAWHDERSQRDHYWRPSLKRLGIRWRRAYATRHTFATVALMTGVPPAYIASQLGHSLQMLLAHYARWVPSSDNGSARKALAAALATPQTNQGTGT
jgi:integrase